MKVSGLLIIECVALAAFWILISTGSVPEFNTIVFFEEGFVYGYTLMSLATGILIGGLIERWQNERQVRKP